MEEKYCSTEPPNPLLRGNDDEEDKNDKAACTTHFTRGDGACAGHVSARVHRSDVHVLCVCPVVVAVVDACTCELLRYNAVYNRRVRDRMMRRGNIWSENFGELLCEVFEVFRVLCL